MERPRCLPDMWTWQPWEGRGLEGERSGGGGAEGSAVLHGRHLGRGHLCHLGRPSALPETCSLTVTATPSYCAYRKLLSSILQVPPGLGAGVTRGLQAGGDPG